MDRSRDYVHSYRKATTGSTLAARLAGITVASSAVKTRSIEPPMKLAASRGFTLNSSEEMNLALASAPTHPRATPISASRRPSPKTMEDRKSTRLNSSHVEISYAVFCLKKKKKKY